MNPHHGLRAVGTEAEMGRPLFSFGWLTPAIGSVPATNQAIKEAAHCLLFRMVSVDKPPLASFLWKDRLPSPFFLLPSSCCPNGRVLNLVPFLSDSGSKHQQCRVRARKSLWQLHLQSWKRRMTRRPRGFWVVTAFGGPEDSTGGCWVGSQWCHCFGCSGLLL